MRTAGLVEPVVVTDGPERSVAIRLALEEVVLTEARYAAGERGPDLHVHRLHADCFYVLEIGRASCRERVFLDV